MTFDLIKAAQGDLIKPYPIWIMRQSGRYLKEYLDIKSKYSSFVEMISHPKTCRDLALLPLKRYPDLDAAIVFTDILVLLTPIGFKFNMVKDLGIVFEELFDFDKLSEYNFGYDIINDLQIVYKSISLTKQSLEEKKPLIGFSGMPFTLLSYMVEGGASQKTTNYARLKTMMYNKKEEILEVLLKLSKLVTKYIVEQVKSGCDIIQLFDTNCGILSKYDFEIYCVYFYKLILKEFKAKCNNTPIILFAKGRHEIELLDSLGFDVLSFDWTIDLKGKKLKSCVQGYLDPTVLFSDKLTIEQYTNNMLDSFHRDQSVIVNLGHGILPNHDPKHLEWFIKAVKAYDYSK